MPKEAGRLDDPEKITGDYFWGVVVWFGQVPGAGSHMHGANTIQQTQTSMSTTCYALGQELSEHGHVYIYFFFIVHTL